MTTTARPASFSTTSSGIVTQDQDPAVRPQDDLFAFANGRWVAETEIPADRGRYGTFDTLREQSDERMRGLIEAAADAAQPAEGADDTDRPAPAGGHDGARDKVGRLYRSFMDTERVESLGVSPIEGELDAIEGAGSLAELVTVLGRLERDGVHGFLSMYVEPDADDPERYVLYLHQGGLGLPDESYYREEKHAAVLQAYAPHVARMLQLVGRGDGSVEPGSAAYRVVELEKRLAASHWDNVTTRDAVKGYNPRTLEQLREMAPALPWDDYVAALEAGPAFEQTVVAGQPSFVEALSRALSDVPLEDWKAWATMRLASSRAPYLSTDLVDEDFAFYGKVVSGLPEQRDRWKRGVSLVEGCIGEAAAQLYVEKYFPPVAKERMLQLVGNLIQAFRHSFEGLDWMGPQTREKALEKLSTFRPKIGYPDRWRDYSTLTIDDDLVGNVRRAAAFEHDRQLAKIGQPIDREEWLMLPQTVNAYYHPLLNEIVFPAAILQPPFFDVDADDAVNYGGIGAVIGHEIGHGFDDQGSRYDATGALRDWWTPEDRERFDERTQALIRQFDAVPSAVVPGQHVNGALTVGENIGDLGGLAIGYAAYRLATAESGMPEIEGLTGPQRFFLGWAQVWKGKSRPEEAARLLAIDPHSPTEARANAARNCDEFHEAFGVVEGDGMWLAPEDRVHIF